MPNCCNRAWMKKWWVDSMECYCYLRNVQDLSSDGKTPHERRFGEPFKGPVNLFGSLMEYQPISAKDQSRLHQFGKKVLPEIFFGYAIFAGKIWKGDILVADIEELETMDRNSVQRQNGGFLLSNREQMPQEQFQRVQKKIELPHLQLAQEEMRSNIGRTARERWKRPSKSEILRIRLLTGLLTEKPDFLASSLRMERSSLPLRPSRHWRCRRKPSDANVRRSCRVKETSRAKSVWPEESHKIAIVLSSNHQLKIPEHIPKRN